MTGDTSVRMMSTAQWLQQAEAQIADPTTRDVLAGFDSDRAKAEAVVSLVAAGLVPYARCESDPNFGMRIGKVLFILEQSFSSGQTPTAGLRQYDAEIASFYRAVKLA